MTAAEEGYDQDKILAQHIQEIHQNLDCGTHKNKVCYVRQNGTHLALTMHQLTEFAKLLVR